MARVGRGVVKAGFGEENCRTETTLKTCTLLGG